MLMWSSIICFQFNESTTTHDSISKPMITQQTKSNLQKVHSNFCYYIHIVSMRCQTTFGQIIMYKKLVMYNKIMPYTLFGLNIYACSFTDVHFVYLVQSFSFLSNHFTFRDYFRLFKTDWVISIRKIVIKVL